MNPAETAQSCAWFIFWMLMILVVVIRHDMRKEQNESTLP